MMSDLRAACPDAALRHAIDLCDAHDLSEQSQPDLVVFDEDILQEPGLAVFVSMLSALAIDWVVAYGSAPNERLPASRQVQITALKAYVRRGLPSRPGRTISAKPPSAKKDAQSRWRPVVIGASTGGIEALIEVLSRFPAAGPPTLVVQHIKGSFIPGLAKRLDRICAPSVRSAVENIPFTPGHIYFAPGDTHHLVIAPNGRSCQLQDGPPQNGHRPSVDVLFGSAARAWGGDCVGVILSGMGRDGAAGLLDMRQRGAWTIGQNKDSSIVYGMPRAAAETGALTQELPLRDIGHAVLKAASRSPGSLPQSVSARSSAVTPG